MFTFSAELFAAFRASAAASCALVASFLASAATVAAAADFAKAAFAVTSASSALLHALPAVSLALAASSSALSAALWAAAVLTAAFAAAAFASVTSFLMSDTAFVTCPAAAASASLTALASFPAVSSAFCCAFREVFSATEELLVASSIRLSNVSMVSALSLMPLTIKFTSVAVRRSPVFFSLIFTFISMLFWFLIYCQASIMPSCTGKPVCSASAKGRV